MEAPRRAFNNKRRLDREIHRSSVIVFLPDGADVGDILTLASGTVSPIDREVNAGTPIVKVEQFPPCRPGDNAGQRSIFFGALRSVVKCLKCECVVGVYQLQEAARHFNIHFGWDGFGDAHRAPPSSGSDLPRRIRIASVGLPNCSTTLLTNLNDVSETQPRNARHSLQCNDARWGTGAGPMMARGDPHFLQISGSLATRPLIAGFGAGKTEDTILPSGIKSSVEDNAVENKSTTFKFLPNGR